METEVSRRGNGDVKRHAGGQEGARQRSKPKVRKNSTKNCESAGGGWRNGGEKRMKKRGELLVGFIRSEDSPYI
jgi:hypothetical protein